MNTPAWTDAHCHLQDPKFGNDLDDVFRRSETFAIRRWLVNGTSPEDWGSVANLARNREGVIPQFGIHPWKAEDPPEGWEARLKEHLLAFPRAGVGEIGLDRKLTGVEIEIQLPVFVRQLSIAREMKRPCTLHVVGAWPELHQAFQEQSPGPFLLHSFGGSPEQAEAFAQKGAFFSFGGAVIRHDNSDKLREAIRAVPEDRLLLETDAPFQHPGGNDNRQEPAGLLRVAEAVANLRGIPVDRLRERTEKNVEAFLGKRE